MNDDLNFLVNGNDDINKDVVLDETSDFTIETDVVCTPPSDVHITKNDLISDMISIDLNKDKFSALMGVLQMMRYSCQDLFIVNGKICQANSKRSMIFDIDLTPILGDISLVIGSIKNKFELLLPFKKQGVDVVLDIYSTGYIIKDAISKIHNKKPIEKFLEQVHLSEQQKITTCGIDYNRRIFSYVWQKRVLDRIINYAKTLATPIIRIECMGDKIVCKAQSLDNSSTSFIDLLVLEDEVDDPTINDLVVPFPVMAWVNFIQSGIVEISSDLYHRTDTKNPSACLKLSGKMDVPNISEPIAINIYCGGYFCPLNSDQNGEII